MIKSDAPPVTFRRLRSFSFAYGLVGFGMQHIHRSVLRSVLACLAIMALSACTTLRTEQEQKSWDRFVKNSQTVKAAKRSYQLGHNLPDGTPVTWRDLTFCLPTQWKPLCLDGGHLEPGRLGEEMKCSLHGQLINSTAHNPQLREPPDH